MEVIREELVAMRDQFGDARRTEITANSADINIEDLINRRCGGHPVASGLRQIPAAVRL